MNESELLRELVRTGLFFKTPQGINMTMLEREIVSIENRHLESYFIVAHKLIEAIKRSGDVTVGPGRGWMIRSYVCWLLGITCLNPDTIGLDPLLTWCNVNRKYVIDIMVDDDSFHTVYKEAIKLFSYNNVARMPALLSDKSHPDKHDAIGMTSDGKKVYLHLCALLICQDGCISDYYPVQEKTDENGNKILCTNQFIPECDNKLVYRFNVLRSAELTRIKKIQSLIKSNGKRCPQLGDKEVTDENYDAIRSGSFRGLPFFELLRQYDINIRMLLRDSYHAEFHYLLNIMALFISGIGQSLKTGYDIEEYQRKHGIHPRLRSIEFPWGFLFKEDVAFFLNRWISFTWTQIARIMELIEKPDRAEIEKMHQIFLQNGIDNSFRVDDLEKIWGSIFNRGDDTPLFNKSILAGELYLSVFLARIKVEFREEFQQQYEEEKE